MLIDARAEGTSMGMLAASLKDYNSDHEANNGYVNMLGAWTAANNK